MAGGNGRDSIAEKADRLVGALLDKAIENPDDLDFQLSLVQTVTRYMAVKARISVPDDGNVFDEWRRGDGGGDRRAGAADGPAPAAPPSSGSQRAGRRRGSPTTGNGAISGAATSSPETLADFLDSLPH